ncbi:altered inheritance of mitochondria protein 19 [Scheffersomyces xylosifermentans]|uniref:altered inheritance of mitochondria protein 19 n=1 Tax=Scheffersomyces xylosifermentans TaxID=1304137 RepID=UPI00315DCA3F
MSVPNGLPNSDQSLLQTLDELSVSPYPAALLGFSLLAKGLSSSRPVQEVTTASGSGVKFLRSTAVSRPTKASCLTFGAANLLGAWITYDGEPVNGAGFNFAWSTLYVIVNGKAGIKSLFRGKVSPAAIGLLAVGNATLYGKKFFWPGLSAEDLRR